MVFKNEKWLKRKQKTWKMGRKRKVKKVGRLTNSNFEKLKNAKKENRFQNFWKVKGKILCKIVQKLNLLFVMNNVVADKCEAGWVVQNVFFFFSEKLFLE